RDGENATKVTTATPATIQGRTSSTVGCGSRSREPCGLPLDVDRLAERGEGRLQGGLGQGRVGVDRVDDLLERGLEGAPERELVDDLGRLGPDDVDPEDLARGLVGDHLDDPFGLAERDRLATGREREPPDRDLTPFLAGARLRGTDRGDLRTAVGARRDVRVIDRARGLAG